MNDNTEGLLISFDGIDSSGKETQSRLLTDRLRRQEFQVIRFQTPDYDTPSGQELKKRLQNKDGSWESFPWERKLRLFANNRAEHREEVIAALQKGDMVIYDRYVPSSLAFIAVEALAAQETDLYREDVHKAIERIEYDEHHMPHEDVSIFLDIPPRIAGALLEQRKEKLKDEDEYTDHFHVQERLYNEYDILCTEQPNRFLRLRCVEGDQLLSPASISEYIWQGLTSRFPQLAA